MVDSGVFRVGFPKPHRKKSRDTKAWSGLFTLAETFITLSYHSEQSEQHKGPHIDTHADSGFNSKTRPETPRPKR